MKHETISLKFSGGLADEHRLPVYAGAESISGVGRSIIIVANYMFEGRVRSRQFKFRDFQVNYVASQEGSFDAILEIVYHEDVLRAAAGGLATLGVAGLLKGVWGMVTGLGEGKEIQKLEAEEKISSGDLGALAAVCEPSIRKGHTVINNFGVINGDVKIGDKNIANMDPVTKSYVNSNFFNETPREREMSVSGFYVNSSEGYMFDYERGHNVSFKVDDTADNETYAAIGHSLSEYNNSRFGSKQDSRIHVLYTSMDSIDDREKKLFVLRARKVSTELIS